MKLIYAIQTEMARSMSNFANIKKGGVIKDKSQAANG